MRRLNTFALFVSCAIVGSASAGEPFQFQDVSVARGLTGYVMATPGQGGGVIAADYDNDGDVDLFAPTDNGTPDRLYQNQGNGTFVEMGTAMGVGSTANSRAALWFDYDGDGDLDLVVARDGYLDFPQIPADTLQLYNYNAGTGMYSNVTASSGLGGNRLNDIPTHIGGMCAGDINNDGYLDLLLTEWRGEHYLFLNNQNGTFTDIGGSSGVSNGLGNPRELSWQPIMFDVNLDGWLDIFICVDMNPNKLFINNHNNTFTDIAAAAGVDEAWNEMGVALADYDCDGKIDMYITNIDRIEDKEQRHNELFRNTSVGATISFAEVSVAQGVDHGFWGWGTTFIDADRDMLPDIAEVNGNSAVGQFNNKSSRFFRNNGTTFDEISSAIGFGQMNNSSALNAFDCDRDGDLDLVQTCWTNCQLMLLDNVQQESANNHYIVIKPRMDGPNRFGIGAEVKIVAGGKTQVRVITAGSSFLGQEPAEAFFGLGSNTMVDQINIKWSSGGGGYIATNIAADQVLTINHFACPGDINNLGQVDVFDLFELLSVWGTNGSTNPRADLDSNGVVNVFDLFILLGNWGDCN